MQYIYQNELDNICFQDGVAYEEFKDLTRRLASDKILHVQAFNFAKNPKYDGYQHGLALMVYKFFDKKSSAMHAPSETLATRNNFAGSEIISNKELAEELHKLIIRKFNTLTFHR